MSEPLDTYAVVTALRTAAVADNHAGRPDRARRRLARARRALESSAMTQDQIGELTFHLTVTLAASTYLIDGLREALEVLAAADALLIGMDKDLAHRLTIRLGFQRGALRGQAGDLAGARSEVDRAVENLWAFSPPEVASVLLTQAMLFMEQGLPAEAGAVFDRASDAAEAAGAQDAALLARHDAAFALYLQGRLSEALARMADVRAGSFVPPPMYQLNEGTVLLEAGLVDQAIPRLEAAAGARTAPLRVRAEARLELARAARLLGNPTRTAQLARQARQMWERHGATAWADRAAILVLQADLDRGRATSAVAHDAHAIADRAATLGDRILADRARTVAAEAEVRQGQLAAAVADLAAPAPPGGRSVQGELHHRLVSGLLHAAAGDVARARVVLRGGAHVLAKQRMGSASLDLRAAAGIHGVRLASLDLDLALPQGSRAVLASLERWQGATDQLPRVLPPEDPALVELTGRLRLGRRRLAEAQDGPARHEAQHAVARLEAEIRRRDWTKSHSATSRTMASTPRQHRDVLAQSERDVVWLVRHESRILGLGIVGGRMRVADLATTQATAALADRVRADLRMAATHQLGPLAGAVWGSLRASMAELDDLLIRPWRRRGDGLVLIPCLDVVGVPWALAPSLAGVPLTISRSLRAYAARTATEGPPEQVHVSVGPQLTRGRQEAEAVAAAWPGVPVVLDAPSHGPNLVAALGRPGIVHVTAHGHHEPQSPLFSRVELDDGPLFAHELQAHGIQAGHVVLGACDVGIPTVRPGEEHLGLAASLLSLGAACVVGAVAPIPDEVAAEVLTAHHRNLAEGRPTDEALALAIADSEPVAAAFHCLGSQRTYARPAPARSR